MHIIVKLTEEQVEDFFTAGMKFDIISGIPVDAGSYLKKILSNVDGMYAFYFRVPGDGPDKEIKLVYKREYKDSKTMVGK